MSAFDRATRDFDLNDGTNGVRWADFALKSKYTELAYGKWKISPQVIIMLLYLLRSLTAPFRIKYAYLVFAVIVGLSSLATGTTILVSQTREAAKNNPMLLITADSDCWSPLNLYMDYTNDGTIRLALLRDTAATEEEFFEFIGAAGAISEQSELSSISTRGEHSFNCNFEDIAVEGPARSTLELTHYVYGQLSEPGALDQQRVVSAPFSTLALTPRKKVAVRAADVLKSETPEPGLEILYGWGWPNFTPESRWVSGRKFADECPLREAAKNPGDMPSCLIIAQKQNMPVLQVDYEMITIEDLLAGSSEPSVVETRAYEVDGFFIEFDCPVCSSARSFSVDLILREANNFSTALPLETKGADLFGQIMIASSAGLDTTVQSGQTNKVSEAFGVTKIRFELDQGRQTEFPISWKSGASDQTVELSKIIGSILLGFGLTLIAEAIIVGLHEMARQRHMAPSDGTKNELRERRLHRLYRLNHAAARRKSD